MPVSSRSRTVYHIIKLRLDRRTGGVCPDGWAVSVCPRQPAGLWRSGHQVRNTRMQCALAAKGGRGRRLGPPLRAAARGAERRQHSQGYVRTLYMGPAQRERALALSRKHVRQSCAPAAQRRIHGGALINIDARKWGQRPHLQASHIIKVVLVRPYVYDCKGEQPRKFRLQACRTPQAQLLSFVTVEMQAAGLPQADRPARWSAVPLSPRSGQGSKARRVLTLSGRDMWLAPRDTAASQSI